MLLLFDVRHVELVVRTGDWLAVPRGHSMAAHSGRHVTVLFKGCIE